VEGGISLGGIAVESPHRNPRTPRLCDFNGLIRAPGIKHVHIVAPRKGIETTRDILSFVTGENERRDHSEGLKTKL
jgi:hypothetical protein